MASAAARKKRSENAKKEPKAKKPAAKRYPGSVGNGMGKVKPKKKMTY